MLILPSITEKHDPSLLKYINAWNALYSGEPIGFRTILSLSNDHYPLAQEGLENAKSIAYNHAVTQYHAGDKEKARVFFVALSPYKNSNDYLALLNASDYKAILRLIGFEDANDVILQAFSMDFLRGEWRTSDERLYFQIGNNDSSTNLPYTDLGDSYFYIEKGVLYFYDKDTPQSALLLGNFEKKNVFKFSIIDADTVGVYCYKDGSTYTLYRQ